MKKNLFRISVLLFTLALGLGNTALAQRHYSRPYSHHHGDGFYRSVRAIEGIAETAAIAHSLHLLDDYTGIRFGYNAASFRLSGFDNASLDSDVKSGVNLGLVFGWNLGHSPIIIEPGIYYSMKGGTLRGYNVGYNDQSRSAIKTTMHMIEIPVVFKYNVLSRTTGITLQPFVGGFLSIGMGGKSKDSANHESYETFGDNTDQFDAFDAGFRMGVGMTIDHLYLEMGYDLGLVNLPNNEYRNWGYDNGFDDAMRSNCVNINIGFNF